eukprot:129427_1
MVFDADSVGVFAAFVVGYFDGDVGFINSDIDVGFINSVSVGFMEDVGFCDIVVYANDDIDGIFVACNDAGFDAVGFINAAFVRCLDCTVGYFDGDDACNVGFD